MSMLVRRGMNCLYMLFKIIFFVAITEMTMISSEEEICVRCMNSNNIEVYGIDILLTCICAYYIFKMLSQISTLTSLQRKILRARSFLELAVQRLEKISIRIFSDWIQLLKEIFYSVVYTTGLNLLLFNYLPVQDKLSDVYINCFGLLATIFTVTMITGYIRQCRSTLQRFFVTAAILTMNTVVFVSISWSFRNSMMHSIFIVTLITVRTICDNFVHEQFPENREFSNIKNSDLFGIKQGEDTEVHNAEEHKQFQTGSMGPDLMASDQMSGGFTEGNRIKLSLNQENTEESSQTFCKKLIQLQKEGMDYEINVCEKVSAGVNEPISLDAQEGQFKRKLNLTEMGHVLLEQVIGEPNNKKLRNEHLILNTPKFNEIIYDINGCKDRLSFQFENCVPSKYAPTNTISTVFENGEDLENKNEQIINFISDQSERIKTKSDHKDLKAHVELGILDQRTTNKFKEMRFVGAKHLYRSLKAEHNNKYFKWKSCAGDKGSCNRFNECDMYETVEHNSFVHALCDHASKRNIRACQNVFNTDGKYVSTEIKHKDSEIHFPQKRNILEGNSVFQFMPTVKSQSEDESICNSKYNTCTDNVVNEIDLRFIYSVY